MSLTSEKTMEQRKLDEALDSNDIIAIRTALAEFAEATQQVKPQILARELLAKLFAEGTLDERLTCQLRNLAKATSPMTPEPATLKVCDEDILVEVDRYLAEVRATPARALTLARAHNRRLETIIQTES